MAEYMLFRVRRDTAAQWTALNPVLPDGEMALDQTTNQMKVGDGVTAWNDLLYMSGGIDPSTLTIASNKITDSTATGRAVLTAATQAAARTAIGAGTGNGTSNLAIGTTSTTAAAGNDSRLSNTRTPTDGTVTTAKLVDGSVTTPKLADSSVTTAKLATEVTTAINNAAANAVQGAGLTLVGSTAVPTAGTPNTTITVVAP